MPPLLPNRPFNLGPSVATSIQKPEAMGDRVLVSPIKVAETVGGMLRPGTEAERPSEGIAVLVGPGRTSEFGNLIPSTVKVGDLLSFPSYAGKEIVDPRGFAPGAYLILRQDEVQINYGPAERHLPNSTPEENHE